MFSRENNIELLRKILVGKFSSKKYHLVRRENFRPDIELITGFRNNKTSLQY